MATRRCTHTSAKAAAHWPSPPRLLQSAVAVYLYLAQALATFPAAQHFPTVRLRAAEAHPPPPESGLAPDALHRPACTVSLGDFVMVDIPPGYDKHTVDRWEHDGTTPHFLVAQVQELFVDAAVWLSILGGVDPWRCQSLAVL